MTLRHCLHIPVCWRSSSTSICRRLSSASVNELKEEAGGAANFESIQSAYEKRLGAGILQPDSCQAAAVRVLQALQSAVLQREAAAVHQQGGSPTSGNPTTTSSSISSNAAAIRTPTASQPVASTSFSDGRTTSTTTLTTTTSTSTNSTSTTSSSTHPSSGVRGAYLWGPVGSGKTALMDLFFQTTQKALLRNHNPNLNASSTNGFTSPTTATITTTTATDAQGLRGASNANDDLSASSASAAPPNAAPANAGPMGRSATRTHFHEFMQSVHSRLHALQQARPRGVSNSRQGLLVYRYEQPDEDPLVTVAREWGSRTAVLCLDELHVTDVADAMIVARLFGCLLLQYDTTVIFTSNRPPRDLYKGGLSRKYFEPFVRLVDEQMAVVRVAAGVDYRRTLAAGTTVTAAEELPAAAIVGVGGGWYMGPGANERLLREWQRTVSDMISATEEAEKDVAGNSSGGNTMGEAVEVSLAYGRRLKVPYTAGNAAFFTFNQLCGAEGLRAGMDDGGALAAPDYLALCRRFKALYLIGIPQLGPAHRDEARRLVTLLDVAYDNRCRLFASSDMSPDALFGPLLEEARRQGVNPRLGLPKSSRTPETTTPSATTPIQCPDAAKTSSPFVPAASVTAALHMRLGPTLTHGSAATNTVHPSEFTGTSAPFAVAPPTPPSSASPSAPQPPATSPSTSPTSTATTKGDLAVPRAVLAEEVLMYHRAASRLSEMCSMEREGGG